jgi:hypothetical protein
MAVRKAFFGASPKHAELDRLLEAAKGTPVTDEQLQEQRVSFAFGNAPTSSKITKESVRNASKGIRIVHA